MLHVYEFLKKKEVYGTCWKIDYIMEVLYNSNELIDKGVCFMLGAVLN